MGAGRANEEDDSCGAGFEMPGGAEKGNPASLQEYSLLFLDGDCRASARQKLPSRAGTAWRIIVF